MAKTQAGPTGQASHAGAGILLDGFSPFVELWDGAGAPYPSRASADWAIRRMRRELMDKRAIARHRGRIYVHLQRFREVAEADAARSYSARFDQ